MSSDMFSHKKIGLIDLYNKLKQSMDEPSAKAIVETFERFSNEILEEIQFKDLATKKDLENYVTKQDFHDTINKTKWQVIGSMLIIFFIPLLLKHWGV